ncbi:MAG: DUF362 domain-containing protein [Actinobacteria bacterium]|nr:DUF362 domain-containing protein [Actinomycetota bacterium]
MADAMFPGLAGLTPPPLLRVRQTFPRPRLEDPVAAVSAEMARPGVAATLDGKRSMAIAVGSRGIAGIDRIVAALVGSLREKGIDPFIVPSMGSHGGATAEGQQAVLAHLGITEESAGAPIRSSMATTRIGSVASPHGHQVPLFMDSLALEADGVIPVNRVKPHTGFKAPIESGLCKMLAIGLGKHDGAGTLHREGYGVFDRLILEAGRAIIDHGHVPFGVAIVENAYDETAVVEAIPAPRIVTREQELLEDARRLMPRLLADRIDVLVVERFGKDVSGIGMDANITGRGELGTALPGFDGPDIARIVVLDLTEATGGNAHGIGLADVVTRRLYDRLDLRSTWVNSVTSGSLACGRIPPALDTDDEAIMAAASAVPGVAPGDARIVRIRDTLSLTEIAVSENLAAGMGRHGSVEVIGPWDGSWE